MIVRRIGRAGGKDVVIASAHVVATPEALIFSAAANHARTAAVVARGAKATPGSPGVLARIIAPLPGRVGVVPTPIPVVDVLLLETPFRSVDVAPVVF